MVIFLIANKIIFPHICFHDEVKHGPAVKVQFQFKIGLANVVNISSFLVVSLNVRLRFFFSDRLHTVYARVRAVFFFFFLL